MFVLVCHKCFVLRYQTRGRGHPSKHLLLQYCTVLTMIHRRLASVNELEERAKSKERLANSGRVCTLVRLNFLRLFHNRESDLQTVALLLSGPHPPSYLVIHVTSPPDVSISPLPPARLHAGTLGFPGSHPGRTRNGLHPIVKLPTVRLAHSWGCLIVLYKCRMPMAASHMLITTQTEAHQLIRETLKGNLGCLPYARLL